MMSGASGGESGSPILFVHGMWHADWCWKSYVELCRARGFSVRAKKLPDHGGGRTSPARLWRQWLGTYAKDVRRAAAAFTSPPVWVGHSLACWSRSSWSKVRSTIRRWRGRNHGITGDYRSIRALGIAEPTAREWWAYSQALLKVALRDPLQEIPTPGPSRLIFLHRGSADRVNGS